MLTSSTNSSQYLQLVSKLSTQSTNHNWHLLSASIFIESTSHKLMHCKVLTHWGRVTHICVRKLTIIGSDNGLSPGRRQAIIWTNAGISLFGPLGSNFNEILIEIDTFSFKKMHLKLLSVKWRPFCLGLNVLIQRNDSQINTFYMLSGLFGLVAVAESSVPYSMPYCDWIQLDPSPEVSSHEAGWPRMLICLGRNSWENGKHTL